MLFRNKGKRPLAVRGIGIVPPGATVDAPDGFRNANFERVERKEPEDKPSDQEENINA